MALESSLDAAGRCIESLGHELERWNNISDKLLVAKTDHRLATCIARNYINGFTQPGTTVREDFAHQLPAAVDLERVGAVFNRVDTMQITLARVGFEMHRAKRLKLQTDAGIAQLLLGLSTSFGLDEQSSSGDHSNATAVPSINDELQRAKTKLEALSRDALTLMAPLLRRRRKLVELEQAGDTEGYGNEAFGLAQELLWRNAVCTTEVRQLTFTALLMFNNVKRTDVEFMDYLLSGLNTLLLLDYHFLDQGFAFEVRDGSIAVSHITMGMESGTQADVDSSRGCPDEALECAPGHDACFLPVTLSFLNLPPRCLQGATQIAGCSSHIGNGCHGLRAHHAGPSHDAYAHVEGEGWRRGDADESG